MAALKIALLVLPPGVKQLLADPTKHPLPNSDEFVAAASLLPASRPGDQLGEQAGKPSE